MKAVRSCLPSVTTGWWILFTLLALVFFVSYSEESNGGGCSSCCSTCDKACYTSCDNNNYISCSECYNNGCDSSVASKCLEACMQSRIKSGYSYYGAYVQCKSGSKGKRSEEATEVQTVAMTIKGKLDKQTLRLGIGAQTEDFELLEASFEWSCPDGSCDFLPRAMNKYLDKWTAHNSAIHVIRGTLTANKEEEDQFLAPSLDYVQVADCQKRPLEGSEDKTVIDFLYVLNLEGPNSIVTQISNAAWRVYEGRTANVTTTRRSTRSARQDPTFGSYQFTVFFNTARDLDLLKTAVLSLEDIQATDVSFKSPEVAEATGNGEGLSAGDKAAIVLGSLLGAVIITGTAVGGYVGVKKLAGSPLRDRLPIPA